MKWSAGRVSIPPCYSRTEFVSLCVVTAVENRPSAYKFIGTQETGDKAPFMLYGGLNTVRIKNGKRRNAVVKIENLHYGEEGLQAGIYKYLDISNDPKDFNIGSNSDMDFLNEVEAMILGKKTSTINMPLPTLYRATKAQHVVQPRITGELFNRLQTLPGYDEGYTMQENFFRLKDNLAVARHEDSTIYPYEIIYGGGLVIMDVSAVSSEIFQLPIGNVDTERNCIKVDILRTIKARENRIEITGQNEAPGIPAGVRQSADPGNGRPGTVYEQSLNGGPPGPKS